MGTAIRSDSARLRLILPRSHFDRVSPFGPTPQPREREPNGKASHGKERSRSRSRSGSRSRDRKRDRKDRDRRSRSRDRERRHRRSSREREREKERERDREREREKEQREKDQRDRERRDSGRDRRSRSRDRDRRDSGRGGGRDDRDSRRREEDRDRDSRRDERDKRDEKRASTSENKKSAEEAKREEEEYQRNIEAQMETLDPEQEAARIEEERRKKREAIMAKHKQKQEDPADPSNVAGLRQAAVDEPTVKREPTDSTKGFWANSKQVALEDKSSELSAREAELKRKLLASDTFKPAPAPVTISIFSPSPSGGLEEAKKIDVDVYVNEDNWDDADGYYNTRSNEIMNDRYEIVSSRGKGVFSTVLFAKDIKADDNIRAIKMIRANDVMYRAGQKEIKIANSLSADDPHNKKHIVRLLEHFEHKGHLCMVFEPMYMNLREVLRQFGRGVGININAVQAYSKQLFIALQHMKNHGIIHCDLKPDNILVNRQKNLIRVCDLGSAMYLTEVEITPYVCSRFYRPPEVILGLPYDCSLDMWSIACCIFELFTGKIMFQGRTNNHMLKLHQEAPHLNPLSPPLPSRASSFDSRYRGVCLPACLRCDKHLFRVGAADAD